MEPGNCVAKSRQLSEFVDETHASGRYTFVKAEAAEGTGCGPEALRMALLRLSRKGRIARVASGFYLIVPNEYRAMGVLPPQLFVDDLMAHLGTDYYVGLLSAAAMHGAGHQQPQEFQVVTPTPRRAITVRGLRLSFFGKKSIESGQKVRVKTDTGYVTVSSVGLTAVDLVAYHKRVGGLNRVAAVLDELCEGVEAAELAREGREYPARAPAQRLGYLLREVLGRTDLTTELAAWLAELPGLPPVPLDPARPVRGAVRDRNWQVLVNTEIESEP